MSTLTADLDAEVVLAALPHAVLVVDSDARIRLVNDQAEFLLGGAREILKRKTLSEVVGPTSPILELVQSVLRDQAPISLRLVEWPDQLRNLARNVDIEAAPHAGSHVILMIHERSLTERIDRQLAHRGAARSVSSLAAMLAHEIKNPLSGIRGAAQLLERDADEEGRELTGLIRSEADRVVKLVNSMEVFSDERPVERTALNVHSVLDHVIRVARTGFASGVRIREEYDPSLPNLSANRDQMVQVFLNLVKNAAEAVVAEDAPEIVVRTAFRAGVRMALPGSRGPTSLPLEISVSDNGPGVAAELRKEMFEPFVTGRSNGTGLGLALVAKVVRDHGGIVDFDTGKHGTTFRVLMPKWSSA